MEHTAAAYILRSGYLEHPSDQPACRDIKSVLAKSWLHLTGRQPARRGLSARLPPRTLARASREARLFHSAAFRPQGPKAIAQKDSIGRDYVPDPSDLIATAGLAALAFTDIGGSLLASAATGYMIATLAEYSMHRWAGHEGGRPLKPLLTKSGWIGERISDYLNATYVSHFVIHHGKTSRKNYATQLARRRSDAQSRIHAEHDDMNGIGRHVKKSDYGMTLTHAGVAAGLLVTLPVHVTLILALRLEPLSAVALTMPSLLYVAASKSLHPYLHKSRDEAMASAGPFMRWLLQTRYAEWISRSHWIHHKGGGGNFNLVPGADLLFSDFRRPNLNLVLRMRADRILGADWGKPVFGPAADRTAT